MIVNIVAFFHFVIRIKVTDSALNIRFLVLSTKCLMLLMKTFYDIIHG